MKRAALLLAILLAMFIGILGTLALALQAPRLDVPEQADWVFDNVTLIEAGRAPRPGSALQIVASVQGQFAPDHGGAHGFGETR